MPTLGHKAYVQLRAKLAAGEFPPGSQLVNRTVSQSIGMSMTPVREAMARLASEGMIEHHPGSGTFVRKISRQEFAQLYDLREVLEPFAGELAATHITANELFELRSICRGWRAIVNAMDAAGQECATAEQMRLWNDYESRFHQIIFKAARNAWLVKIASDLQLMTFSFCPQRSMPEFLSPENARTTYRGHVQILKALKSRDAAQAPLADQAAHPDWAQASAGFFRPVTRPGNRAAGSAWRSGGARFPITKLSAVTARLTMRSCRESSVTSFK